VPRLRQIAASVDPVSTVSAGLLAATIRTESLIFRSTFLLVLALAGAAFLLSATGLYALMSFTISQRTREIGIRSALGASMADVLSALARRAALQVGAGLALGVAWGWVLLDNSRNDVEVGNIPLTLALTAAIAGSVCVSACAHPALRGLRIHPTEALRES
jgi:putative ABC transport system permease protein